MAFGLGASLTSQLASARLLDYLDGRDIASTVSDPVPLRTIRRYSGWLVEAGRSFPSTPQPDSRS